MIVKVSVPIRGLFNITGDRPRKIPAGGNYEFPSPSGDYLI